MIKNILAGIGVVLLVTMAVLASPALGETLAPNSTLNSDAWPPPRYMGDAGAGVAFLDPSRIDEACGKAPAGWRTEACQEGNLIVLPNPCTYPAADDYARLACHELAHKNGWPRSHGDARKRAGL